MELLKGITTVYTSDAAIDAALLILRVGLAALMLGHGLPKLKPLVSAGPVQFPPTLGLSPKTSLTLAATAEVLGSLMILVGFATRLAVVPLILVMAVAALHTHRNDPFARKELPILYLVPYLLLLLSGSGKYSVDYLLQ